jgi:hypothetical protein
MAWDVEIKCRTNSIERKMNFHQRHLHPHFLHQDSEPQLKPSFWNFCFSSKSSRKSHFLIFQLCIFFDTVKNEVNLVTNKVQCLFESLCSNVKVVYSNDNIAGAVKTCANDYLGVVTVKSITPLKFNIFLNLSQDFPVIAANNAID